MGNNSTLYDQIMKQWMEDSKTNQQKNKVIYETTPVGERAYDVFSRLMKERIIIFDTSVNSVSASEFKASLLCLDEMEYEGEKHKDITVYVDSPGGSIYALLGMYDTMQYIKSDISTICTGFAASAASLILTAGAKGKRYALPNSTILIHQPMIDGVGGQVTDVEIITEQLKKNKKALIELYIKHTGQSFEKLERDMERDCWMTAQEAVDYGLIDGIISKLPNSDLKGDKK